MRQDTTDFLTAFAVGAVLGVGATLLLRPEPRSAKERLIRELRPKAQRAPRGKGDVRAALRERARRPAADTSGEAVTLGKELLEEFRGEVARILNDARDELRELSREQARGARRQAGRARRKPEG
ncbi:MAG TPA: hypothetical protein VFX98_19880 [Longimicrobiaceae bacterium]|nr:hypothetical protein [Longimicrobiaceae bacterium]